MISFKNYLIEEEQKQENKLKDIDHFHLHHGHDGVAHAANLLDSIHKHFLGKNSDAKMIMKYNGEPVTFGRDKNKNYFVASDPNVPNYSHDDIERNHEGDHHTIGKLKDAFEHLHKILPDHPGMYDGKIFTKDQMTNSGGQHHIVTKDRTYSISSESGTGKSLKASKIAVVPESMHNGSAFVPLDDKTKNKFKRHPDVHVIDPELKSKSGNYTADEQREFLNHRKAAEIAYSKTDPEAFDHIGKHGPRFSAHIDQMVSKGIQPSVDSYLDTLKKNKEHSSMAEHVFRGQNHFEKALELQGHLRNAKNILAGVLHKNSEFSHSANGQAVEPEGALVTLHKGESKGVSAKFRRT